MRTDPDHAGVCLWPAVVIVLAMLAANLGVSPTLLAEESTHDNAAETATEAEAEAETETAPAAAMADAEVAALLAELGSDDYHTREAATVRLLADEQIEASHLIELYTRAETAEQRHRLLDIARHHTIRRMRERHFGRAESVGSLGVHFDREIVPAGTVPGLDRPAVRIIRPLAGFPAYAHLRPGDLVVAINDEPTVQHESTEHFRSVIQRHARGEQVTLTLYRDGQRLDPQINLASSQALENVYPGATARLSAAYREQWSTVRNELRTHGPDPEPLRIPAAQNADQNTH